ncbi:Cellulose synthase/poly-beta-1,6-N-acetylglucosamine synthase-like glycosyltransferase [Azospirillaceae bacterium]
MRKSALLVLLLVLLVISTNVAVWALLNQPVSERPWAGIIQGVGLSPYQAHQNPMNGDRPTTSEVENDLQVLSNRVRSVRTYSARNGAELVPSIAHRYGLSVTAGAWIQGKPEIDEPEIESVIRLARENSNVARILVGNEAILRTEITVDQAITLIKRVKSQVDTPVSTAEPWHVWLKHPELAATADFIAVHILPYWEGVPVSEAVNYAQFRYNELREKYPDKHIMISEIGWPSEGAWRRGAEASLINQSSFIRSFLNVAAQQNLDYSIMEAFDQPWKRVLEGAAGTAWGMWDAHRIEKFPMVGDVLERPSWPYLCGIAILLALGPTLFFLRRWREIRWIGKLFYCALIQSVSSIIVWTVVAAMTSGLATTTEVTWGFLILCQMALLGVMLLDGLELAEVLWMERFRRPFKPIVGPPRDDLPKVSIHTPCHNEPPHMVIDTLNALARLDYPDFEVLVIDNNTQDETRWRPIEAHCKTLGERFRFFHLDNWPGFKAGALNFGISQTAPDAEIIAVIDSDYQVTPDWLSSTVPYFDRPKIALVQSPQDYRAWDDNLFKKMINWEYQGFFHIGMVQRNERNAIIQHGTMTMMRKNALIEVGRWAEWCITEDAELGLRLFEAGYKSVYMKESFGKGLVPDSFMGYKTQRFRWAYGAVQILKTHWKEFLPGAPRLSRGQKYHFVTGWLPWFADAAHLIFGLAGIFWSIGLLTLPKYFEFPPNAFLIPTLSVFFFKIMSCFWLYQARVTCGFWDKIGAAVAGMALTHTVGRAVWLGLFTSGRPFVRTPKCEDQPALVQGVLMAQEELWLMLALWGAAIAVVVTFGHENRDAFMWSGLLLVQSFPYISALATSMINVFPGLGQKRLGQKKLGQEN